MSILDELITNRQATDPQAVADLAAVINTGSYTAAQYAQFQAATMRGAYNYTDLNRVQEAIAYLAALLEGYGYAVNISEAAQAWSEADDPTPGNTQPILLNVAALQQKMNVAAALPETMRALTWQEANEIERVLAQVGALLKNMQQAFVYCGTVNSGMIWGDFT